MSNCQRATKSPPGRQDSQRWLQIGRLAEKLDTALRNDAVLARIKILFEEGNPNRERVQKIRDELRWGADTVNAMAKLRLKRVRSDSPNPQIRLAMYLVQWITSCTGGQQYRELTTLIDAAFSAAGKRIPSWIDRLGIEMNLKRKRRKDWVGAIGSQNSGRNPV